MKVIKTFISFSVGTWLGAIVSIITVPILTRFFSPEEFGKAAMFTIGLNVLMMFIMFGVDQAFVRFYYEENLKKLLVKCLKITFVSYIVSLVFVYFFRIEISVYLFGMYDPLIIFLLTISSLLYVLNNYSLTVLRMNQMGWQYSLAQFLSKLFELIFVLVFFYILGKSYSTLVLGKVISIFLVTIVAVYSNKQKKDTLPKSTISENSIMAIVRYSFPLALTGILTWMMQSVDRLAIKEWSTFRELGIYVAAYRIISIMDIVVASFSVYWTPLALERFINKGYPENREFYKRVNSLISLVMVIISVGIIGTKDLLVYMLGEDYRQAANILPFLVFFPMMYLASETTVIGINFFKKVKWHLFIITIVLIVNIIGNLSLVPIFSAKGAALSTAVSYIFYFILRTHISLKYYKIEYELRKFYSLTFLVFLYALYSSFFFWTWDNSLFGLIIIGISIFFYWKNIREILQTYFFKG